MARLQDYQTVTPTSSDKLLIVQSQGQGLTTIGNFKSDKMDKANPTGTGSLSLNRKANTTTGEYSTAEGYNATASSPYAHAEGLNTIASANSAHAEGQGTTASGTRSHAEGQDTTASGARTHAEGQGTTASDNYAHAEGMGTTASGTQSHSEGYNTTASGASSHAEGSTNTASGAASHVEGYGNTSNHLCQHVFGQYNVADTSTADATARGNYIEIVGKGTSNNARSNARTLDWSGNEVLAGGLKINGTTDVGDALKAVKRYTFNSSSPITIEIYGGAGFVVMGFVQSIGNVILFVSAGTSGIDSVINLLTGQSFSSQYLTFSVSNNVVTISSTNASNSDVTVFAGGRIS